MSKRLRYKPVRKNERLDISLTLSQAATMLDEVAIYAMTTNDQELKLAVADRWIAIGELFAGPEETGDIIDINDNVETYGFGGVRDEVIEDE